MKNLTNEGHLSIQNLFCTSQSSGNYKLLISVINCLFSVTAILGNTLILIALHKESSLHPPSKLLYRCLAMTDLLVGLISEPSAAVYSMTLGIERDRRHWLDVCFYSATICTISFTILCTVSLLTLAAISVDRLLALLSGVRYRHIVTMGRTRAFLSLFWISSIGFASISVWKYEIPFSFRYGIILLSLMISAFCYLKIYLILRHRMHINQVHEPPTENIPLNIARYRKTVSTALWVQLALVICYLPYSIVIAIITINGSSAFLDALWGFSAALVYLNSSLNPFLYCWKIRSLQQAVKETLKRIFS
ncbi:adenosine receptor A3-like [Oculina patagonica]